MASKVHDLLEPGSVEAATGAHLSRLFEKHGKMVYSLCCLVLQDRREAEDATQQTFLAAYRSLLGGTEPRDPAAWLAVIARNECRRWFRKRPPSPTPLAESLEEFTRDPATLAGEREEISAVRELLAGLPQHQRDAFILREFCGLSYREIAGIVDRSRPAVEAMVFTCRRRLRERLKAVREAAHGLALPITLQGGLTNAIPGFSSTPSVPAAAGAGTGGLALAKLGSIPLFAKISAGLVAVGAATVTIAETQQRQGHLAVRPTPRSQPHVLGQQRPSTVERPPAVGSHVASADVFTIAYRTPAPPRRSGKPTARSLPSAHISPKRPARHTPRVKRVPPSPRIEPPGRAPVVVVGTSDPVSPAPIAEPASEPPSPPATTGPETQPESTTTEAEATEQESDQPPPDTDQAETEEPAPAQTNDDSEWSSEEQSATRTVETESPDNERSATESPSTVKGERSDDPSADQHGE